MDRTFALEILPILGIVLIVLVLLLREVASGTFFSSLGNTSLPPGGLPLLHRRAYTAVHQAVWRLLPYLSFGGRTAWPAPAPHPRGRIFHSACE